MALSKDDVENAMETVLDRYRDKFWVDPEVHYNDHKVFQGWQKTVCFIKQNMLRAAVYIPTGGFITWLMFQVFDR